MLRQILVGGGVNTVNRYPRIGNDDIGVGRTGC